MRDTLASKLDTLEPQLRMTGEGVWSVIQMGVAEGGK